MMVAAATINRISAFIFFSPPFEFVWVCCETSFSN